MAERSRLELLKQMGASAVKGLKMAVTGVDVIIDPNEPPTPPEPEQAERQGGDSSPPPPPPEAIGTEIGRRALAAAEHRVKSASMVGTGSAVAMDSLLAAVPLTLATYPGPGVTLLERILGLTGTSLPPDGDPEVEATAHDLAWLPLKTGKQYYDRVAGGRLIAVGGYKRAALVQIASTPIVRGIWCALGDDALADALEPKPTDPLLFEYPDKLWRAAEREQVGLALLGGTLLERALTLPGATVVAEVSPDADLGLIPAWGLFSTSRIPALQPIENDEARIAVLIQPPQVPEPEAVNS